MRVEQQLKRKSTSKYYGSYSYLKKHQGQGILGVTPSKPKDDKGKTIEKQPLSTIKRSHSYWGYISSLDSSPFASSLSLEEAKVVTST